MGWVCGSGVVVLGLRLSPQLLVDREDRGRGRPAVYTAAGRVSWLRTAGAGIGRQRTPRYVPNSQSRRRHGYPTFEGACACAGGLLVGEHPTGVAVPAGRGFVLARIGMCSMFDCGINHDTSTTQERAWKDENGNIVAGVAGRTFVCGDRDGCFHICIIPPLHKRVYWCLCSVAQN
jgi:hypothetical protein